MSLNLKSIYHTVDYLGSNNLKTSQKKMVTG